MRATIAYLEAKEEKTIQIYILVIILSCHVCVLYRERLFQFLRSIFRKTYRHTRFD